MAIHQQLRLDLESVLYTAVGQSKTQKVGRQKHLMVFLPIWLHTFIPISTVTGYIPHSSNIYHGF